MKAAAKRRSQAGLGAMCGAATRSLRSSCGAASQRKQAMFTKRALELTNNSTIYGNLKDDSS
jgi:hypothetical protein